MRNSVLIPQQLHESVVNTYYSMDELMRKVLSLDLIFFLIGLILKDYQYNIEKNGFNRLCSCLLKKLNTNKFKYPLHIEWMQHNGFIKVKNHRNFKDCKKQCKGYKIEKEYLVDIDYSNGVGCKEYNFNDTDFIKKSDKMINCRKIEARSTTVYLTKWLDDYNFRINSFEAKNFVETVYADNDKLSKNEMDKIRNQRKKRLRLIENFMQNQAIFSRDGKDNRLHTCFTNLPSDLKQFVSYEGKKLKECDIKNSQPFIFTVLLQVFIGIDKTAKNYPFLQHNGKQKIKYKINRLINNDSKGYYNQELYKININTIINKCIMLLKAFEPIDFAEVFGFVDLVKSGKIYEEVGNALLENGTIWEVNNKYCVKLTVEKGDLILQEKNEFETLRKCAKKVVLNALYINPEATGMRAINDFKAMFPSIWEILNVLKSENYKDLPILMQRMEAKCILDYCSKRIAKKHPNILLVTRHDSLSTTEDNIKFLSAEFQILLDGYFGVEVKTDVENW